MQRLSLHHFYKARIRKACVHMLSTGCGEKNDAKITAVCIRLRSLVSFSISSLSFLASKSSLLCSTALGSCCAVAIPDQASMSPTTRRAQLTMHNDTLEKQCCRAMVAESAT